MKNILTLVVVSMILLGIISCSIAPGVNVLLDPLFDVVRESHMVINCPKGWSCQIDQDPKRAFIGITIPSSIAWGVIFER